MVDFQITQNDTYSALRGRCVDENGAIVDLTGATARFHMKKPGSDTPTIDAVAFIENEPNGVIVYAWEDGDTADSGMYMAEFEVTYSDGGVETFPTKPLVVYIREELA